MSPVHSDIFDGSAGGGDLSSEEQDDGAEQTDDGLDNAECELGADGYEDAESQTQEDCDDSEPPELELNGLEPDVEEPEEFYDCVEETELYAVDVSSMTIGVSDRQDDGDRRGQPFELTVDSGAGESVVDPAHWPNATLAPSEGSKRGQKG